MNNVEFDSGNLWKLLMFLINFMVVCIIAAIMYFLLEDQIIKFLHKPKYSQEQLDEFSKRADIKSSQERNENWDLIENGIHVQTGLKADDNLELIIKTCTSCHSAKLITQNRASREGWKNMILWMQETQGLTDLGTREPKVLDYLEKYYAPQEVGRRQNINLEEVEWYILEL